jgi:hypothetical protein
LFYSQLQFLVILLHSCTLFFMDDTCTVPKAVGAVVSVQSGVMFFLFSEFYVKAYMKKTS